MGTPATVDPALPSGESTPAQRLQAVRDSLVKPAADIIDLGTERTKLIDALLGSVLLFSYTVPGGIKAGLVAMAALIALSVTRTPRFALASLWWPVTALYCAIIFAVLISISGPDLSFYGWPQRAVRLLAGLVFLGGLVSGRIHYPSVVRGMAAGLLGNALLYYAGVAPKAANTHLTGYLYDKNQAGFAYAVVAVLLLGVLRRRNEQLVALTLFGGLVWLTGSRTGLAALACGILWFVARPYLQPIARLALAAGLALSVEYFEQNYARVGIFSERLGSDELRQRIDELSWVKTQQSPWWGQGLGEAWVSAEQGNFFFHNSYWTLLIEGGWPYALATVGAMVLVCIRPFHRGSPPSELALSAEAGGIVILVCAISLGEVFGTTAATLVLGAGFIGLLQSRPRRAAQSPNGGMA